MPSARMASVTLQCLQVALELLTAKTTTAFNGIEIRWGLTENRCVQGHCFGRCSADQRQYMKEMHEAAECVVEQDGESPWDVGMT